ncbi:MAG: VWA domain-containing protein, partial [Acholeplasmatales bacterium]|nr:VWA domain-containing protein [Acholeplasmatales bacterium]
MSSISFDNPFLLLIGIPLILASVIPYIIAVNKDNKTKNNLISFICHLVISVLVTLAMAKTTFELVITETNVYVLADVSYSSSDKHSLIDEYIENLEDNCPRNSKLGIVCFGKDYELLVPVGEDLRSVSEANVDDSATNIKEALEYTATLFSNDVIKRIVIISDGKETKESNIVSVVAELQADDVYIDAIYINNNITSDTKEVQINQIDYVASTYVNNDEKVYGIAQASDNIRAYIKLYNGDELIKEKAISLVKGYNSFSFDLDTSKAGVCNYRIVIEADEDKTKENNTYLFNQIVTDKIKMLFISENEADRVSADELYGSKADITYYINNMNVPYTVEELSIYDEFVISNFDVRKIYNSSQFINSINTLVSEFGKSLITFGNTYIQNNDEDEIMSSLSDLLPTKYGNDENEGKLVTLVLDISRSMEQLSKFHIAKKLCSTILDNLKDNDMVMIVAFYGEVGTLYEPIEASKREEIKQTINNLEAAQGSFMGSALDYACDFIKSLPYSKNEVILISDGLPYGEENHNPIESIKNMAEANIKVSTINIVNQNGSELMRELASIGGGYYYFINELKDVEGLVLNEVLNSLTETILDKESEVNIKLKKNDLVSGIESLPNVGGLYNNRTKSSATVVLNATYVDIVENEYEVPLYSYWNYGNGRVSSFASTISGAWASNWLASNDGREVLSNILSVNQPDERIDSAFMISTENLGTITKIIVDAPTLNNNSQITINVKYPDNTIIENTLVFDSQYYVAEIPTELVGKYDISLSYNLGQLTYTANHSFNVSYLPEYDSFTIYEASDLYYMVTMNGIVSEDGHLVLKNDNSNV